MKHLRAINQKAVRIEATVDAEKLDIVALQQRGGAAAATPHVPMGCSIIFAPDWTSKCALATKDWRNVDIVFP